MVDGVETDAKFANLHWIFFFHTVIRRLDTGPIFLSKNRVILCVQGRSLKFLQGLSNQLLNTIVILPLVE
jgi:hypothetical protein